MAEPSKPGAWLRVPVLTVVVRLLLAEAPIVAVAVIIWIVGRRSWHDGVLVFASGSSGLAIGKVLKDSLW